MTQKLTLSVDVEKIRKAKYLSRKRKRSVSKLFEDFIDELDKQEARHKRVSIADKLKGAFGKVPKDFDWQEERFKYLKKKYGH